LIKILIIGLENAVRSQILEAYLSIELGRKAKVFSCGLAPTGVDPQAIRAMAEDRIVIAGRTSDELAGFQSLEFDIIISFNALLSEKAKEFFPEARRIEIAVEDINGFGGESRMQQIRQLRNELRQKASELQETLA
jgi:protein-tyrosine-phosphatase